ncbi:hypothetical protein V2G26_014260 [Clonostachys chloroleuca]
MLPPMQRLNNKKGHTLSFKWSESVRRMHWSSRVRTLVAPLSQAVGPRRNIAKQDGPSFLYARLPAYASIGTQKNRYVDGSWLIGLIRFACFISH